MAVLSGSEWLAAYAVTTYVSNSMYKQLLPLQNWGYEFFTVLANYGIRDSIVRVVGEYSV